jgi:ubiquinone/menaquinone biosynthesis C-methylase UbiE
VPNDEKEQEHMDLLGNMFNLVLGGKPFLAPIGDHPQRILDLGTGTGAWAIEVGQLAPKTCCRKN